MQGLWSRAASSQSACRCVACLNTTANGVSSRAATAASRRRLRIGNSVTVLYSSIFAAAALADARAKDKRRHEWEEKIAAVKEEVNELVDEEKRILQVLASRTKRSTSSRSVQVRQYSTAVGRGPLEGPRPEKYPLRDSIEQPRESGERQLSGALISSELEPEESLFEEEDMEEDGNLFSETDDQVPWTAGDPLRIKAIQKLALKQLAIRLLLRPVIASNYSGLPLDYAADSALPKLSVSELMTELRMAQRRIYALRYREDESFDDLARDMYVRELRELRAERGKLDDALQDDINVYLSRRMPLPELLLRISDNLMSSREPDRPRAFQLMIMAFTKTRQNDLVDLVLRTMLPNQFELTTSLIITTLTYFRKSKDLKGFDLFLKMLRGEGYPVNLRSSALYKRETINGVDITVPPSAGSNPVIYGTLIAAALRFDQTDRAEAWMQAWRATGFMDDFSTLCAFLRFYTVRKDWETGRHTLERALAFMLSSTSHPERRIERLIVHMVHFCDSCKQEDASAALIAAAVSSGFDWRAARRQSDISSDFDPAFQRWRTADAESASRLHQQKPIAEKCYSFTALVEGDITAICQNNEYHSQLQQSITANHSERVLSTMLSARRRNERIRASTERPSGDDNKEAQSMNTLSSKTVVSQQYNGSTVPNTSSEELLALKEDIARLKTMVTRLHETHEASQNGTSSTMSSEATSLSDIQTSGHHQEQERLPVSSSPQPAAPLLNQFPLAPKVAHTPFKDAPALGNIKDAASRPHAREEIPKRMIIRTVVSGSGAN